MISKTFDKTLRLYFHVEVTQDIDELNSFLNSKNFPKRNEEFRKELLQKINNSEVSVNEFEKLTGIDYESQEEVNEFLIDEIWKPLYGDEPICRRITLRNRTQSN